MNGTLVSKDLYSLTAGHIYRLTVRLAGNQRVDQTPDSARLRLYSLSGGIPTYYLDQKVLVNNYAQDFHNYSFSFVAPIDVDVTISVGQEDAPSESAGLLLDRVRFEDVTDLITMLDDDFDAENVQYVAPRCGVGSIYALLPDLNSYGYAVGYNCYGEGCLDSPPGIQTQDPNPLPDIETGTSGPPTTYTSTKEACASCQAGSVNFDNTNLVPAMTSNATPSGQASASTGNADAWKALDHVTALGANKWASDVDAIPAWLQYIFGEVVAVSAYAITAWKTGLVSGASFYGPRDFELQGSNDGSTWTTLDARTGISWYTAERKTFIFSNSTEYLYYRLYITALPAGGASVAIIELELFPEADNEVCRSATRTSDVSQSDADAQAYAAALTDAQDALNCQTVYTSTQQYTARCGETCFGQEVTKSATATSIVSQAEADAAALAAAQAAAEAALDCTRSNNTQAITINDATNTAPSPATPYPSVKFVSGLTGLITKVTVSIKKFTHSSPPDVTIILLSPTGEKVSLMRKAGGVSNSVGDLDFVFDDAAGAPLPNSGFLTSGTYQPSNYDSEQPMPDPCPDGPFRVELSFLNGLDPNGCWSLWVADFQPLDVGEVAEGWDLTITTA